MDKSELISQMLHAYKSSDHGAMAACYHEEATFEDIAFRAIGRKQIHAMWHMICKNGITVTVNEPPGISGSEVVAKITDVYVFSDTGRKVVNPITCRFRFRDGLIISHQDECDAVAWANQAMGGLKGWLAGRMAWLRRRAASKKLKHFIQKHPEYA